MRIYSLIVTAIVALSAGALYGYVTPMIGGGQVGMADAPMIMPSVDFDGTNISVGFMPYTTPILRALVPPSQFDPAQPWAVLGYKAYNYQFGWTAGVAQTPLPGTWFWIEQTSTTTGLEAYQRSPASPSYAPIFGTPIDATHNSPLIWKWPGSMTHNAYAVAQPDRLYYTASYRVYIGDINTGAEVKDGLGNPVYGSADITFTWQSPPKGGDCDQDYKVDGIDLATLSQNWDPLGTTHTWVQGDFNYDGKVDGIDLAALAQNWAPLGSYGQMPGVVPEPMTVALLALGGLAMLRRRR